MAFVPSFALAFLKHNMRFLNAGADLLACHLDCIAIHTLLDQHMEMIPAL